MISSFDVTTFSVLMVDKRCHFKGTPPPPTFPQVGLPRKSKFSIPQNYSTNDLNSYITYEATPKKQVHTLSQTHTNHNPTNLINEPL